MSLHGIEGAFADPGAKTVIPRKVIGKFSLRLVPDQHPDKIEKLVKEYLNKKWAELGSPNKLTVNYKIIKSRITYIFSKFEQDVHNSVLYAQ